MAAVSVRTRGGWALLLVLALGGLAQAQAPSTRPSTRPATPSAGPETRPAAPRRSGPSAPRVAPVAAPRDLAELREIQKRVQAVVKNATPATVGVMLGAGQGSGVIISKDGYVLTAGHVSSEPDKEVTLVLADGRRIKGKTLGMNRQIDSGLIKITQSGEWPYVEMGTSADLKPGEWVVGLGHPGGYRKDRPPVLRLGRVLTNNAGLISTDVTLVGGDSGGPLFNLDGKVVGIHSRIGASTLANIHVPVDTYTQTWDRLAAGDAWGDSRFGGARGPMLGVSGEDDPAGCRILSIAPDSPAAKAGVKVGDIIVRFDGMDVTKFDELVERINTHKAGDEVSFRVLRAGKPVELKATLARRPAAEL